MSGTVEITPGGNSPSPSSEISSIIIAAGMDPRKVVFRQGMTVREVCNNQNISLANQNLYVGKEKVTPDHVLTHKSALMIVPVPKNA